MAYVAMPAVLVFLPPLYPGVYPAEEMLTLFLHNVFGNVHPVLVVKAIETGHYHIVEPFLIDCISEATGPGYPLAQLPMLGVIHILSDFLQGLADEEQGIAECYLMRVKMGWKAWDYG